MLSCAYFSRTTNWKRRRSTMKFSQFWERWLQSVEPVYSCTLLGTGPLCPWPLSFPGRLDFQASSSPPPLWTKVCTVGFRRYCQNCPPKYLYKFAFLFAASKSFHGNTSLTKRGIIRFFSFFQSDECRIVSHCLFKSFLWILVRSNIFSQMYQPFSSFANYVSSTLVIFLHKSLHLSGPQFCHR